MIKNYVLCVYCCKLNHSKVKTSKTIFRQKRAKYDPKHNNSNPAKDGRVAVLVSHTRVFYGTHVRDRFSR